MVRLQQSVLLAHDGVAEAARALSQLVGSLALQRLHRVYATLVMLRNELTRQGVLVRVQLLLLRALVNDEAGGSGSSLVANSHKAMFIVFTAAHEPRVATLRVHILLLPTLHVDDLLIFSSVSLII